MTIEIKKRVVVPRGYVWAKQKGGPEKMFNKGQAIIPGYTITKADPESVLDEMGLKSLPEKKTPPTAEEKR